MRARGQEGDDAGDDQGDYDGAELPVPINMSHPGSASSEKQMDLRLTTRLLGSVGRLLLIGC